MMSSIKLFGISILVILDNTIPLRVSKIVIRNASKRRTWNLSLMILLYVNLVCKIVNKAPISIKYNQYCIIFFLINLLKWLFLSLIKVKISTVIGSIGRIMNTNWYLELKSISLKIWVIKGTEIPITKASLIITKLLAPLITFFTLFTQLLRANSF